MHNKINNDGLSDTEILRRAQEACDKLRPYTQNMGAWAIQGIENINGLVKGLRKRVAKKSRGDRNSGTSEKKVLREELLREIAEQEFNMASASSPRLMRQRLTY